VAVFDDALRLRHDSNYLLVEAEDVDADELADEARRLDRPTILFPAAHVGEGLATDFARRGWFVHHGLVMVRRHEPERAIDTSIVGEVDEAALRAPRRAQLANEPWATPELVEQRLDAKLAVARSIEVRFFAVGVDGDPVSWTDLYLDRHTAQVEDVATLPDHRGRGYATAVVARAVEEAERAGCDFVFLVTDADDWPQTLYRRLGFDDVGRYVKFFRALT
jgi:ribosomal protein S18 acetylase RimI-like enzyme